MHTDHASSYQIPTYKVPGELLKDRIILVTGAGDGIGKAAALGFARLGATLILLGKTVEKLEQVYDQIEQEGGPQPAIIPLNLETATIADYQKIASTLEQEFCRLDGLLLNAAILGDMRPLEFFPMDTFEKVMKVNVNAQFLLVRTLMPLVRVPSFFLPRPKTCTPQVLQDICAIPFVLKRYSVSSSSPFSIVTASRGTKDKSSPLIWQWLQLHSITGRERSISTSYRTLPQ